MIMQLTDSFRCNHSGNMIICKPQKEGITMKKLICVLLTVLMLTALGCTAFADSANLGVEPGEVMPDFTVFLTDGSTATLSELLKENDLVVLNLFASWCGPCENEFPEMEKVYEANRDRMVILSVSFDPDDTMEMISDYKSDHGLTFPMGLAGDALSFIRLSSYPTTIFIDREGKVAFIKVGAFVQEGSFDEKVSTLLSANFDGTPLPSEIARSHTPLLLGAAGVLWLLLIIGRWCLFRKAGKPGWHSIIPFLSNYQEYALGWKGWLGILAVFCQFGAGAIRLFGPQANWVVLCSGALFIAYLVLRLVESAKLSKAYGKGTGIGILLFLFLSVGRFILGVSKARYRDQTV